MNVNKLTVFSRDIISVYTTDSGMRVVNGRELHAKLKVDTKYPDWFPRMCEYGFTNPDDFTEFWENGSEIILENAHFKSPQQAAALGYQKNHLLGLDMAKHLAMIQRTPEGKEIRDKLIALETNVAELSPQLQLLINMEIEQRRQAKALEAVNRRVDDIREVVALNPNSWREECRALLAKVSHARGGHLEYQMVNAEVFKLVDQRARVSLETRLINKRRRMADEGVCKSKRDRINKVDVIADDPKLIEIYTAIVKEMAVKHGVTVDVEGEAS